MNWLGREWREFARMMATRVGPLNRPLGEVFVLMMTLGACALLLALRLDFVIATAG